jgi:hypothetical protein
MEIGIVGGRQLQSAHATSWLLNRTRKTAEAAPTEPRFAPKVEIIDGDYVPLQARSARPAAALPICLGNYALHPRFVLTSL